MHNHIIFYTMSDMNHDHIIPFNPTKWTISILSMRGFHFSFIASSRMLSSPPYYLFKIMRIYGLRRQFIWSFLFMFKPPKMTLMSAFPLLLQLVCSLRQTLITPSPTPLYGLQHPSILFCFLLFFHIQIQWWTQPP